LDLAKNTFQVHDADASEIAARAGFKWRILFTDHGIGTRIMLIIASSLVGYSIEAEDGRLGTVRDFLFDDRNWRFRWLVVETGNLLAERQVLIHPSAIANADHERKSLSLNLTRDQIKNSPSVDTDLPVSRQKEVLLYDYYDLDPLWGLGLYDLDVMGSYIGPPRYFGPKDMERAMDMAERLEDNDPDLRSLEVLKGYHVHATDGSIGHIENVLIDDSSWDVRYLIIATSNWWIGKHVLISPYAVDDVSWGDHQVSLNVTKEKVKSSPPWDPLKNITELEEQGLHRHYGWPGYGWRYGGPR
jgi:sporulation protein YlmC with PRC-barrel domain